MACSKIWRDKKERSIDYVYKVPAGKGERAILSHIGCAETGLMEGYLLLFRGSKSLQDSDYYSEMNWKVFSHWCEQKGFPAMHRAGVKSLMVLDRETYHTKLDEEDRRPLTS